MLKFPGAVQWSAAIGSLEAKRTLAAMKVSAEQLDLALRRMLYLQLPLDTRNWIVRVVLRKFQIAMLQVEFAVLTWIPITNCTIIVCLWQKKK